MLQVDNMDKNSTTDLIKSLFKDQDKKEERKQMQLLVSECVGNIKSLKKCSSYHFRTIDHLLSELHKKNKRIEMLEN
jgi:hypothetical protein